MENSHLSTRRQKTDTPAALSRTVEQHLSTAAASTNPADEPESGADQTLFRNDLSTGDGLFLLTRGSRLRLT